MNFPTERPRAQAWDSSTLNTDQQKIVKHQTGAALVIAGAGSGKTRVITHRVASLIQMGVPPYSIMMLTFTNKASREMAGRVAQAVPPSQAQGIIHGTFHSLAARFLRQHPSLLRYQKNFSISDASDSRELLKNSVAQVLGATEKRFPKANSLQDCFSMFVNTCCTGTLLKQNDYANRPAALESWLPEYYPYIEEYWESIIKVYEAYRAKKRLNQTMDFDDLLENWLDLLVRNPELPLRKRLKYLLVDEYQDTNLIQSEILHHLSTPEHNLMVVGDDAQSIYSWRGANFENIMGFPEKYAAETYRMEQNYRSTPQILELANHVINHNTRQFEKHLYTKIADGDAPELHRLPNPWEERDVVVQQIIELQNQGVALAETSILYRSHRQALILQMELTRANIPFVVYSGVSFFEQAHVKDMVSFLRILFNPLDEVAWVRILKMLPGIGDVISHRIFEVFRAQKAIRLTPDNQELQKRIPKKARSEWNRLLEAFHVVTSEQHPPAEIIRILYQDFYKEIVFASMEKPEDRDKDIEALQEFVEGYEHLDDFLNELALLQSKAEKSEGQKQEALTLTTIHRAKGLEWDVVFIIGLTEGSFPHQRCMEHLDQLEEERRLFYVGITRARKKLILTSPASSGNHYSEVGGHSSFVEELPEELLNVHVHEAPSWGGYY